MSDQYLPDLVDEESEELPVQPEEPPPPTIEEKETESEDEVEVVKQKLKTETIFKPLKVKPVDPFVDAVIDDPLSPPSEKQEEIVLNDEPIPKKPKQKRKMSEKQLEALARGRKNSLEKRKAKANINKKTVDFHEDVIDDTLAPPSAKRIVKSVDKNEMEDAIANAIHKYDNVRKARKAEKQAAKKIKDVDKRLVEQINRAMDPSNPDYWSGCFNIT